MTRGAFLFFVGALGCGGGPVTSADGDTGGTSGTTDAGEPTQGGTAAVDGTAGSDTGTGTGGGDDDDAPDLGDPDPDVFCPFAEPPGFAKVADAEGLIELQTSVCGFTVYRTLRSERIDVVVGEVQLIRPTGTTEMLREGAEPDFGLAGTGHLLYTRLDTADLVLHDMVTGEERSFDGVVESQGFVPTFTRDDYAWFWTCNESGVLRYGGIDGMERLAEDVRCASVAGAGAAPVLAFADADHVLHFADLDTGEIVTTDIDDVFVDLEQDPKDRARTDVVSVTRDGTVAHVNARHRTAVPLGGTADVSIRLQLYDAELDQVVVNSPGQWKLREGAGTHHTLTAFDDADDEALAYTAGREWIGLDDELRVIRVARDGEHLFAIDPDAGRVVRVTLDTGESQTLIPAVPHAFLSSPTGSTAWWPRFSPHEETLVMLGQTDQCMAGPFPCNPVFGVWSWNEEAGTAEPRIALGADFMLARDDGLALIRGRIYPAGIEADDVYFDDLPPRRICDFAHGAVEPCFDVDHEGTYSTFALGAETDRGVLFVQSAAEPEQLLHAEPPDEEVEVVAELGSISTLTTIYGGRIAVARTAADGDGISGVWFGRP